MDKFRKDVYVLTLIIFVGIAVCLIVCCWPCFDWYSYHCYNGWAFLNHRLDVDLMPASFRSYFNPILDTFNYLLIKYLNKYPATIVVVSSLKYSFFLFLSYKVYDLVINKDFKAKNFVLFFSIVLLMFSPILFMIKGFEFTDLYNAIIVLFALYLFLKTFYGDNIKKNYILIFFSSFLIGAAFGLKYTNISFCIALPLVVLLRYKSFKHPIKTTLLIIISMFSGFLLTDGFWLYTLWHKFHNPIFPYFNEIFHSPYASQKEVLSGDFMLLRPKNIYEWILFPVNGKGLEVKFYDLKTSFTFLGFFISLILALIYKNFSKTVSGIMRADIFYFLFVLSVIAYYTNAVIFGNVRYVQPVYSFCALFVAVYCYYLSALLPEKIRKYDIILLIVLIAHLATFRTISGYAADTWHRQREKFINVENFNFEDNSLVFCSNITSSNVIPFQNPNVQYAYFPLPASFISKMNIVKGNHLNFYYKNSWLERRISKRIREDRNIYIIISTFTSDESGSKDVKKLSQAIKYYSDNTRDITSCRSFKTYTGNQAVPWPGPYLVCKIE